MSHCESTPSGIPVLEVKVGNGHTIILAIGHDRVLEFNNLLTLDENM